MSWILLFAQMINKYIQCLCTASPLYVLHILLMYRRGLVILNNCLAVVPWRLFHIDTGLDKGLELSHCF